MSFTMLRFAAKEGHQKHTDLFQIFSQFFGYFLPKFLPKAPTYHNHHISFDILTRDSTPTHPVGQPLLQGGRWGILSRPSRTIQTHRSVWFWNLEGREDEVKQLSHLGSHHQIVTNMIIQLSKYILKLNHQVVMILTFALLSVFLSIASGNIQQYFHIKSHPLDLIIGVLPDVQMFLMFSGRCFFFWKWPTQFVRTMKPRCPWKSTT